MNDQEYCYLKKKILELTKIDLNYYKTSQMRRRLDGFIARYDNCGVVPYCRMLEQDNDALDKLRDFLTINVSEFFRDMNHFQTLKTIILPSLLRHNHSLNIWSAGCANGAEAYSIAIILEKLSPFTDHRILGTDIDETSLIKAIAGGPYTPTEIRNVPLELAPKYLTCSERGYHIINRIQQKVEFRKHDLLHDAFEQDFDLIACRNVVIYFSEEAKRRLNQNFHKSLKKDGVLFIGGTETMLDASELGFERVRTCFYRKCAANAPDKAPVLAGGISRM
jgi:chemotaxis protein methyltransferase CheR